LLFRAQSVVYYPHILWWRRRKKHRRKIFCLGNY